MPFQDKKIHILDSDTRRRAQIAFRLSSREFRAEIYENLEELLAFPPTDGLLLVNDSTVGSGLSRITKTIGSTRATTSIAIFGECPPTKQVVDAILSGAIDYLEWPFDMERLETVIAQTNHDASSHAKLMQRRAEAQSRVSILTPRERDVLKCLIQGLGNKEIALQLAISPRTVEVHRAKMLEKLSARSSAEAVRVGIYAGFDD